MVNVVPRDALLCDRVVNVVPRDALLCDRVMNVVPRGALLCDRVVNVDGGDYAGGAGRGGLCRLGDGVSVESKNGICIVCVVADVVALVQGGYRRWRLGRR